MKLTSIPHGWARKHSQASIVFLTAVIIIAALALRLYGLNWDQGNLYHPDERAILMRVADMEFPAPRNLGVLADVAKSPLNPHWFPYGSLPLYLLKSVQSIAGNWTELDVFDLRLPARVLSAFADTGTVIAIIALGTLLYTRRVGLLGAGLLTFTVLHIQISHFFTVDSFLVFFAVLSLVFMARVVSRVNASDSVLAGLFIGLALASKASAAALFLPLVIAHLIPLLLPVDAVSPTLKYLSRRDVRRAIPGLVMDGLLGLVSFSLTWLLMAHAYDQIPRSELLPGRGLVASLVTVCVFVPLATTHLLNALSNNRDPSLLRNLFPKHLVGIIIAVVTAAAVFFITMPYAFLDWSTYLGDIGEQWLMSQRVLDYPYTRQYENTAPYLYYAKQLGVWGLGLPIGLVALGGLLLSGWMALRRGHRGDILLLSWVVPIFILVGGQEVKFLRYLLPITPLLALMGGRFLFWLKETSTSWHYLRPSWVVVLTSAVLFTSALYAVGYIRIYAAPHPATAASGWFQENVPPGSLVLKEHWDEGIPNMDAYQIQELPMYDADTVDKMQNIATALSNADYLLFYSHRLYGTIPRLPDRYPLTTVYYDRLLKGDLGYTLVQRFTSYPNLGFISLMNTTFSRPGLPKPEYNGSEISSLVTLNLGFADESFTVYDHPKVLVFRNTNRLTQDQILSILTTRAPPEPIGLLLTSKELQAQRAGGTFSQLFDASSISNRFPAVTWLLLVELVSLVVLPIAFVLFRGLPDRGYLLSKIMGLLLLAYIPWVLASQGLMNFGIGSIYLGLATIALPAVTIAILKRNQILIFLSRRWRVLAFEEALFVLAFIAFLFLRWANPDLWHPFRGGEKPMDFAYLNAIVQSSTMPPYDPWFAGGFLNYYYFGHFIVANLIKATAILPSTAYNLAIPLLFALTMAGAFSVVYNLTESLRERRWAQRGLAWGPSAAGLAAAFMVVVLGNLDGMLQLAQGVGNALLSAGPFTEFDFWRSTRMMPPDPPGHEITEFPYFTFLFGDLHAHLIAIPFSLLAIGLSLNLVLTSQQEGFRWRAVGFPLFSLAVAIGTLATINTWDYPSYLLLGIGALALSTYAYHRELSARLLATSVIGAGLLVIISYVAFLPFHQRYVPFSLGVGLSPAQTGLHHYLAIHGLFLFIVVSYLVYEGRSRIGSLQAHRGIYRAMLLTALALAIASLIAFILDHSLLQPKSASPIGELSHLIEATTYATVPFLFLLMCCSILLFVHKLRKGDSENPQHLFLLGLIGGALSLGIVVDVVVASNDIERMNTVFKLYLQAWVLYGLAGGIVLWYLLSSWGSPWQALSPWKALWLSGMVVLIASASVYPVLGTRDRLSDRFSTEYQGLDGRRYMEKAVYRDHQGLITLRWDAEAIDWLLYNIVGTPVIAEGNTPLYRWGSRVSVYTGLPTIIGWDWHQTQQRFKYRDEVKRRIGQVHHLFSSPNKEVALQILQEYDVSYIYVGRLERLYYPESGLAKFEQMTNGALEVVYRNQEVTIYQVNNQRNDLKTHTPGNIQTVE